MNLIKRLFGGRPQNRQKAASAGAIESILIVEDRDLYFAIRNASDDRRRCAVVAAARFAVTCTGLQHPALEEAFACLEAGRQPGTALISAIEQLVENLDQEECRLQKQQPEDEGCQEQALKVFLKARAASSLASTLSGTADEAVYEAIHATQDLPKVREMVLTALKGT